MKKEAELITSNFSESIKNIRGFLHSKESINEVLKNDTDGISIYIGIHPNDGTPAIILMPQDWEKEKDKDKLIIQQIALLCPPLCD